MKKMLFGKSWKYTKNNLYLSSFTARLLPRLEDMSVESLQRKAPNIFSNLVIKDTDLNRPTVNCNAIESLLNLLTARRSSAIFSPMTSGISEDYLYGRSSGSETWQAGVITLLQQRHRG